MALLLASEEMNRRQADELSLLRSGGRAPSPAASDFAPGPVDGGDVARLEARLAEQQLLIEQLAHRLQHPPPPPAAVVPPAAVSGKNKSEKPGRELRENPDFLKMSLGAGASALDVSNVVITMLSLFGTPGSVLQQVLLWILQLPSSATSLVPAVDTDAVHKFCADHLKITLGTDRPDVYDDAGTDCFGLGADSACRRGVFQALLGLLKQDGPWQDMDNELLISFKPRLQPSLRLSDSVMALSSFAALLAQVLHRLEHGPSSVLVSVVDTFFSFVPYPERGTPNQVLRSLADDLKGRVALKRQLDLTPFLLPVALATSFVPQAPGAAGVLTAAVTGQLMGLAADTATTEAQLLDVVERALRASSHTGTVPVSWTPSDPSPYSRLLTAKPAADSLASSTSPAAGALPPPKPAPSKSKAAPRSAAAKSQQPGGDQQRPPCPHGAACPTHGALFDHCKLYHSAEVHRAIQDQRRQQNLPFFNKASRKAVLLQIAAQGGPPAGSGGGGQPRASPSAAAAAAPLPQPVPQPVQQPLQQPLQQPVAQPVQQPVPQPSQQPGPSPLVPVDRVQALANWLNGAASSLGSSALPAFAALPSPVVPPGPMPPALAAAAPAPVAASRGTAVWGGDDNHFLCLDSGSKYPYGLNASGAPTRPVQPQHCVTSTGDLAVTSTAFDPIVHLKDTVGQVYAVTIGSVREQPALALPSGPGQAPKPVMLLDLNGITTGGGQIHAEGQFASDAPGAQAVVTGYVRLRVPGVDPRVEPHGRLSGKILGRFDRGVFELPTCTPPVGTSPVSVLLGASSAPLSAASVAPTASERSLGALLKVCKVWHSFAAPRVHTYAASSAAAQSAFRAAHGGRDAAAELHLGLSHFAACLEEVSSVVLGELGVAVPSCSAVPFPAPAAASVSPALSAPSALVALFDLVRNAPAPSSGAVLSAAPPASPSSSSSLLSPQ